ncbi:MAG: type II toxin-antitoxin system VapC family toxin [Sphingomonas sp.]
MSWFVDASAVVAILAREPDWEIYADRADEEAELLWSPLSRWESIAGFRRQRGVTVEEASYTVTRFGEENGLTMVSIGGREAELAVDALARYGRGSGSPAKLNMGDCFAYACARANNARLLYKGDDFALTDLA